MNEPMRAVPESPVRHSGATLPDAAAVAHQLARLARSAEAPWLHAEIAGRMAERLSLIRMRPQALLNWWGFLGHSLDALSQAYPEARQYWVEPTESLRRRSVALLHRPWWKSLLRRAAAVEVLAEQDLTPAHQAQLLWANMMLHACPDLPAQLGRWHAALAVDGFVMFSCLGSDSLRELRPIYAAMGWGAPLQDWVDMHDIGDMMVQAGFADPVMDQERITLTWGDAQALLKDLRALGGNLSAERFKGLRGRRWHASLLESLAGLKGPDGRLHLSLEIVYGHAFKPAPRAPVSAETSISLEQMRAMVRRGEIQDIR